MKPAGIIGIILVIVGIVMLAYGGYTSFTTKENVAKLGPLKSTSTRNTPFPLDRSWAAFALSAESCCSLTGRERDATCRSNGPYRAVCAAFRTAKVLLPLRSR